MITHGLGGIAPFNLNFFMRRKSVAISNFEEGTLITHWIGSCVGSGSGLHTAANSRGRYPYGELDPKVSLSLKHNRCAGLFRFRLVTDMNDFIV